MANWTDWIPGSSLAKIPGDIYHGNYGQAGKDFVVGSSLVGDPLIAAKSEFFDKPAAANKAALDAAAGANAAGYQGLQNFYAQQKQNTLGYYKPLEHMFSNAYGTEGLQAPQLPPRSGGAR